MLRINEATIYSIFFLWYTGLRVDEIQRQTGCNKITIRYHLAHRYLYLYSERLRRRISPITKPPITARPVPEEYITLADASYFYHSRPSAKTLRCNYMRRDKEDPTKLEVKLVDGRTLTTREWVLDHALQFPQPRPGIYLRRDTLLKITGIKHQKTFIPANELETLPLSPATISRTLRIMDYTGLQNITLTPADLI